MDRSNYRRNTKHYLSDDDKVDWMNGNSHAFQIDRNLTLRLDVIKKRSKVVFEGRILYSNGMQVCLSPDYWKLLTEYHRLQQKRIFYQYDFTSNTVSLRSCLYFGVGDFPLEQIKSLVDVIKQDIRQLVGKLYRYRMITLRGRFLFAEAVEGGVFCKELCDGIRGELLKGKVYQEEKIVGQSEMVDEKEEQRRVENIMVCPIEPVKGRIRPGQLPMELQYGPKNIKYHFAEGLQVSQSRGGFFSIEKLLVEINKKKLQIIDSKSIQQNQGHSRPQHSQHSAFVDTQILVRKRLKPEREQTKVNRLKILKELVVVRQIRQSKHLINYYLNSDAKYFMSIFHTESHSPKQRDVQTLEKGISCLQVAEKNQHATVKEINDVFMDFHPHTLDDFIRYEHNAIDSKIEMCLQMVSSVIDIHRSNVIHRDLKPENVLIDFTTNRFSPLLKLIDFSESAIHVSGDRRNEDATIPNCIIKELFEKHSSRFYASTMPYSPPECQLYRQKRTSKGVNNFQIDSWSLGMLIPEIYTGKKLLNYSKPYEDDLLSALRSVEFENYCVKRKKGGFGMVDNVLTLIGLKNVVCEQERRMDVGTCYNILSRVLGSVTKLANSFMEQKQDRKELLLFK